MITLYTTPNCVQCIATKRALDGPGLAYRQIDLSQDPDALELVRSLGHRQAPVVVVERAGQVVESWAGFQPGRIREVLQVFGTNTASAPTL